MNFKTTVEVEAKLNEKSSSDNINKGVNNINKSGKTPKIKVEFDAEKLREQGLRIIKASGDVEKEIRKALKPRNGEIDIKSITDANNQITQYVATIKERNQIVDQYILKLRQVKELDGSVSPAFVQTRLTVNDKGKGTLLTKQIEDLTKARAEIENLTNQFLTGNGSKILGDSKNIDDILNKLAEAETRVNKLFETAGRNPKIEMSGITTFINQIKAQANDYRELEENERKLAEIRAKDKQTIDDQTHALDIYQLTLQKVKSTTLNSESASSLLGAKDIDKVTDSFSRFEAIYDRLRPQNNDGLLISKNDLHEIDLAYKQLTQDIKVVGTEMRKELSADTSAQHMKDQVEAIRPKVVGLVKDLQSLGLYEGQLKNETIALIVELSKISTPKDITAFGLHLQALTGKIGNIKNELNNAFSSEQFAQKLQLLSGQVKGYMQQNSRAVMMFKSDFDALIKGIASASTPEDLERLRNTFKNLQQEINNAGKAGLTFGERITSAVKKFAMWTGMTNIVMKLVHTFRQMITNVKELDTAMTLLRRVTDETDSTYKTMFENATSKAKELNTSIKDLINSTAEFAKLGYKSQDAEVLAQAATVYKNVGQISTIEEATKSITSTLAGFKLQADDVWDVVDKFDNVGNKFAITSQGIGESLMRSAASLAESNNTLDESIALVTTANSVVKLCHLAIVI